MLRGPPKILEFTRELITLTDRHERASVRLDCRYGAVAAIRDAGFVCYSHVDAGDSSSGNDDSWLTRYSRTYELRTIIKRIANHRHQHSPTLTNTRRSAHCHSFRSVPTRSARSVRFQPFRSVRHAARRSRYILNA